MRLRYKFTFFIALIAVTISSLFVLVFFVDQNRRLESQAKELASDRLDNMARAIGLAMRSKDSSLLETEIRRALDDREVVSIQITNGSGEVIAERAEDFDPNATWTKVTPVQLSDSTEGSLMVRFSTDVYVGNLAHNVGVLAVTTLMSIVFICLVSHLLFKNIVDTRLRKAISEVEGRSKNLRTLVECSKSIGSQTTLRDISQCIATSFRLFSDEKLKVEVYFSHLCFDNAFDDGFYRLDEYGFPTSSQVGGEDELGKTGETALRVLDTRSQKTLAMVLCLHPENVRLEEAVENFQALLVNISSAITNVRLEQAFGKLATRTRELGTIFSNINQGICMIDDGMFIRPDYSAALEHIFDDKNLSERNFLEAIVDRSNVSTETRQNIHDVLAMSIGSAASNFNLNAALLPRELFVTKSAKTMYLEIDWTPIVSDEEIIQYMMVTIRDVTSLKELESVALANRAELNVIEEIVNVEPEKFDVFMNSTYRHLENIRQIVARRTFDGDEISEMKRDLHSLKGNSRALELDGISKVVNDAETKFEHILKETNIEKNTLRLHESCLALLEQIKDVVDSYRHVCLQKLNRNPQVQIAKKKLIGDVIGLLEDFTTAKSSNENLLKRAEDLYIEIVVAEWPTLNKMLFDLRRNVKTVASRTGKLTPECRYAASVDYVLSESTNDLLLECFTHLTTNSIDHGFDTNFQGALKWRAGFEDNQFVLYYSDNGKGLNLNRLFESGKAAGLLASENPSDLEIANTIFASGTSSASKVTEFSGRGVGMNAVREALNEIGGGIEIQFSGERKPDGFRQIQFKIWLPSSLVTKRFQVDTLATQGFAYTA